MDAMRGKGDTMNDIAPPAPVVPAEPIDETAPMKNRGVRIDEATWRRAGDRARREGLTVADVIRHYLREYAGGDTAG